MASITIKKLDYDETVYPAVSARRPRSTRELSAAATLIPKLQSLGTHNGETYVMDEEEATLDLSGEEVELLRSRLREVVRRQPTSWAVALVYLTDALEVAVREAQTVARVSSLDSQIAERQATIRDLDTQERQLRNTITNLEKTVS